MLTAIAQIPDVSAPPADGNVSTWLLGVVIAMLVAVVGYTLRETRRSTAAAERFTSMLATGDLLPSDAVNREKRLGRALDAATTAMRAMASAQETQTKTQEASNKMIEEVVAEWRHARSLMFSERDYRPPDE